MNNHHSPASRIYSQRLGALSVEQFQAALDRFGLGTFVDATPVSQGLFGQNVFLQSTQGEYVLRGVAHYDWQFPKEQFGAALLHERTSIPVAYPYLLDSSSDIFGWPYLLMPRLHGQSPADPTLTDAERREIAHTLGENLARIHQLTWPFAGMYDLSSNTIQPFRGGFAHWIVADIREWLSRARRNSAATTDEDVAWIEQVIAEAQSALEHAFEPCFVMNDYNPGNVLVAQNEGVWEVTGVFDLMEYYFGDGEADLMRLIAVYLDQKRERGINLARAFVAGYLKHRPAGVGFTERYGLYMLRDRLIAWEFGTRPTQNWFAPELSFRDYAEPFTTSWRYLAPDAVT